MEINTFKYQISLNMSLTKDIKMKTIEESMSIIHQENNNTLLFAVV
jgi:hypothetical protein